MPVEYFRWWFVEERTGKRRRTRHHMSAEEAAIRYPGATPDRRTRLMREASEVAGRRQFVIDWVSVRRTGP